MSTTFPEHYRHCEPAQDQHTHHDCSPEEGLAAHHDLDGELWDEVCSYFERDIETLQPSESNGLLLLLSCEVSAVLLYTLVNQVFKLKYQIVYSNVELLQRVRLFVTQVHT